MKPIAIYGAGSFGREVLILLRQINEFQNEWNIIGFFDDNMSVDEQVHSLPILGNIESLNHYDKPLALIIAVGNPVVRKRIVKKITNPLISFPILVHPSVQLAPYQNISVGEGTIIGAGNILTVDIKIGKHVLLNIGCSCGHVVEIADYVSIMPNCMLFGPSTIGESCFISTGAAIMNRVDLAPLSRIGVREVVMNGVSRILE